MARGIDEFRCGGRRRPEAPPRPSDVLELRILGDVREPLSEVG